jgi:oligopeptide/dipeptide ABC transporter ATP-binding protein
VVIGINVADPAGRTLLLEGCASGAVPEKSAEGDDARPTEEGHSPVHPEPCQVVESGTADALAEAPKHPYTQALFASAPSMDPERRMERPPITGDPPNPINPPSGCRFRTRCAFAIPRCAEAVPAAVAVAPGHDVACYLV